MNAFLKPAFSLLGFVILTGITACLSQTVAEPPIQQPSNAEQAAPKIPGSISGTIVDPSGAVVAGAKVTLTGDAVQKRDLLSDANGQFSFIEVPPGTYQLTVTASGFATQTTSGTLQAGEISELPQINLAVAANRTEVQVGVPQTEVAEEQIKIEEQQRVLAVIPNFYVSYIPNAAPLNARQKFKLAWKTMIDPFTFVVVGGTAGVQQAQNHFRAYGQGAEGYAKRFGAGYADAAIGTFIGGAILPSILKQDPRYFYKGTGTTAARARYAIKNAVMCRGDNRRWQVNYSFMLGTLAAGGISNLYYPREDRGAGLTFENAGIGIAQAAFTNLLQEFLIPKLTPKAPKTPKRP